MSTQECPHTDVHTGVPTQEYPYTDVHAGVPAHGRPRRSTLTGVPTHRRPRRSPHTGVPSQEYPHTDVHVGVPTQECPYSDVHAGVPTQECPCSDVHAGVTAQESPYSDVHTRSSSSLYERSGEVSQERRAQTGGTPVYPTRRNHDQNDIKRLRVRTRPETRLRSTLSGGRVRGDASTTSHPTAPTSTTTKHSCTGVTEGSTRGRHRGPPDLVAPQSWWSDLKGPGRSHSETRGLPRHRETDTSTTLPTSRSTKVATPFAT